MSVANKSPSGIAQLFGADGISFVDSGILGTNAVPLESSACRIDLQHSYVVESGENGEVHLAITFKNLNGAGFVYTRMLPIDRAGMAALTVAAASNWYYGQVHVIPQDVILSNNTNGISVQAGGASVTYQVNIVSRGNYSGTVQLNCTAPTGLTCTGGSVTLPAGGSVSGTITVAASSTATVGNTSVMMSTTAGNSHTLTQAVNVTAVPTVSFGPDQYQTASYGTDAFYTITVNGNNWPAGRQVTLSKGSISNGLGATLYEGTTAAGSVITTKTITVPGSALFRITANIPPTQNSTNVYSASVKAVDTLTGADLGGTFLGITIVGSTPQAASLSVVSSLTVPVGGTVATAVGLTTSGTTTSSTQPSYTVSANTSGGGAVSLTPAGSTTTTANATIKVESPVTATVLAGSLAVGSTFNVTFSGSAGSGLQAKTMQVKVVPLNQANPDDPTDGGAGLGRENTNDYVYNDGISSAPSKYYCVNCPKSTSCAVSDSLYVIDARQTPGIVVRPNPISINSDNSFQMTYLATSSVQPGVYWIHCFDTSRGINRSFPDAFSLNVLDAATKPVITSVCDAGVTASNCPEPIATTGTVEAITINGANLKGTSGANPVIRVWGPSGGPYTTSLAAQIASIVTATRIDATVTVPDGATLGDYDVVVFPQGTASTALGFLGTPDQPSTIDVSAAVANRGILGVGNPATIYLVHGIGQGKANMETLHDSLVTSLGARTRFKVDAGFDFSECAISPTSPLPGAKAVCSSSCGIGQGAINLANYIFDHPPNGNIVLIGYSMGGLIAREMMGSNYLAAGIGGRSNNAKVVGLITLGTPNLGYPYDSNDEQVFCPQLVQDMAGGWYPLSSNHAETSSNFLDLLKLKWINFNYRGYWLAAAGTAVNNQTRSFPYYSNPSVRKGCLNPGDGALSDGIVCRDSALFIPSDSQYDSSPHPTTPWEHPGYVHTNSGGGWGTQLIFGSAMGLPVESLYQPTTTGDLFKKILGTLNATR